MQRIKTFIHDHPHMWWGLFLPVYLGIFFTIEHFITDNYWATQLPIDYKIPFLEGFAPIYASWSVLLFILGIYLILKDGEGFRRYMWSIMITFLFSTLICALIPNGAGPAARCDAQGQHLLRSGGLHLLTGHQHQRVPQRPRGGRH